MNELSRALGHFRGTTRYYQYVDFYFTDGVHYLVEEAQAYWLLDVVWTYQCREHIKKEPFLLYQLAIDNVEQKGTITCSDGNGNILLSQETHCVGFPLEKLSLYFIGGVLLLPSEY